MHKCILYLYNIEHFFCIFILAVLIVILINFRIETTVVEMLTWTFEQVYNWAVTCVGITDEQAELFRIQQVDGVALLEFTKENFENMGILMGPLVKILKALKPFRMATTGSCFFFPVCILNIPF